MAKKEELLHIFPDYLRGRMEEAAAMVQELQEIRLRVNREVILSKKGKEYYISMDGKISKEKHMAWCITEQEIEAVLSHICSYSLYAFADEIRQGFLTIPGGHRIGLAGQVILQEEEQIRNMKNIRYMNIRVSHQVKGAAASVLPYLYEKGNLCNVLIISPPGCGKTTLLRDIIRQISDGNPYGDGKNIGVVDERSEIAGSYLGKPQNDVGQRTDILDACPKGIGMMMLIRSMAPDAVAVDELGCEEDVKAMYRVMQCGSKMIATIHGNSIRDVLERSFLHSMREDKCFDRYIFLDKRDGECKVRNIYNREFTKCFG